MEVQLHFVFSILKSNSNPKTKTSIYEKNFNFKIVLHSRIKTNTIISPKQQQKKQVVVEYKMYFLKFKLSPTSSPTWTFFESNMDFDRVELGL